MRIIDRSSDVCSSDLFPPGECSYGTGKVKLRPRHIFWVFPGVGEQPQGKRSKQQQHKCRFEDGFEIHGPMTRRGRSSCSKKKRAGSWIKCETRRVGM